MVNFFEPDVIIDGKPYKVWKYEEVLNEQLLIAMLSKGACTVDTTNYLPVNDRRILLKTLQKAEQEKQKRYEEMKEARDAKKRSRRF